MYLHIFREQCISDCNRRQVIGEKPLRIEGHIHLAQPASDDRGLADTAHGFDLRSKRLVRVFCYVTDVFSVGS